jgi:hypothetical protein
VSLSCAIASTAWRALRFLAVQVLGARPCRFNEVSDFVYLIDGAKKLAAKRDRLSLAGDRPDPLALLGGHPFKFEPIQGDRVLPLGRAEHAVERAAAVSSSLEARFDAAIMSSLVFSNASAMSGWAPGIAPPDCADGFVVLS